MQVTIYYNPRCSKSREALDLLRKQGVAPRVIEYLKSPISVEELQDLANKLEMKPIAFTRTNESAFAEFGLSNTSDDDQVLRAISKYPVLLQRPIIVRDGRAVIGRPPSNLLSLFEPTTARKEGSDV